MFSSESEGKPDFDNGLKQRPGEYSSARVD